MSFSEETARLLRLVDAGVAVAVAARELGISRDRAYALLKAAGRGRGAKTRITVEHRRIVIARYKATGSVNAAARVAGLSHNATRRILVNAGLVFAGVSTLPVISLALGFAGACAIITAGVLLARKQWLDGLRFCGEHSIVIYLAFFLPMAATRTLLLKTSLVTDVGVIAMIVTAMGVFGALAMWWAAKRSGLTFLFERPALFWIAPPKPRVALQAAE